MIKQKIIALVVCVLTFSQLNYAAVFVVSSNADSGPNTLRQAIINSNGTAGLNTITFTTLGGPIVPLTDLPTITNPVVIDGYAGSPGGATPNTNPINAADNAVITIEIQGPGPDTDPTGVFNGLVLGVGSDGSTIRGLSINSFANIDPATLINGVGILVNSDGNTISGNFLGTDTTGFVSLPNFTAIQIGTLGVGNLIGGPTPAARNLISGQYNNGGVVSIKGDNTTFQGNTVGLDKSGTIVLMPSARIGLVIFDVTTGTLIGGTAANFGNVISGHDAANVLINSSTNVTIQNNFIGTDVTGTANPGFNGTGILAENSPVDGPINILISSNLISANTYGIRIGQNSASYFPIIGAQIILNKIGTNVTGSVALANSLDGIWLQFAQNTYIFANTISGNGRNGIVIGKGRNSNIKNNFIGTTSTGGAPLGNGNNGIQLGVNVGASVSAFGDVIGGAKPGEGNLIANNGGSGIEIKAFTEQETIIGNTIAGNLLSGILIDPQAGQNYIGFTRSAGNVRLIGDLASQGDTNLGPLGTSNTITANHGDGITVLSSNNNTIETNLITLNLGNGISLIDSSNNLVGGLFGGSATSIPPVLGNSITGNIGYGVEVEQTTGFATDNSILSNQIYKNTSNGIALITG